VRGIEHLREIADNDRSGLVAYEKTTARELLEIDDECEKFQELARINGLDTPLYRADYARREGDYSPEEIDEEDALIAYIGHDLHGLAVFTSADEAREALASGHVTPTGHQEIAAQVALRDLLGEEDG